MTYGVEQERAAAALTYLITRLPHRGPRTPTSTQTGAEDSPVGDEAVLGPREQLRTAILERVEIIGQGHYERVKLRVSLEAIGTEGIHLLHRIVRQTPHSQLVRDAASPTQVLTQQQLTSAAEAWAAAARAVTVGNHDLAGGRQLQPGPAGTWHLLADAAELVEALVVLDSHLERAGLLTAHTRPEQSWSLRARRAITSTVAREARWNRTDHSPDQITAAATIRGGDGVLLVRDLDSFAAAQRRLADFLRPQYLNNPAYDPDHELTLRVARPVLLGQAKINQHLARQAAARSDGSAERFTRRAALLVTILETSRRYTDLTGGRPVQQHIAFQQLENLTGLTRLPPVLGRTDAPQLADVEAATRSVATELATALRREVTRKDSSYTRVGEKRPGVGKNAPFPAAATALINHTRQPDAQSPWTDPVARKELRAALTNSPSPTSGTGPIPMHAASQNTDLQR